MRWPVDKCPHCGKQLGLYRAVTAEERAKRRRAADRMLARPPWWKRIFGAPEDGND